MSIKAPSREHQELSNQIRKDIMTLALAVAITILVVAVITILALSGHGLIAAVGGAALIFSLGLVVMSGKDLRLDLKERKKLETMETSTPSVEYLNNLRNQQQTHNETDKAFPRT